MIFLSLFWTFFKIGLFTFGGGYAMIPMIQSSVVEGLQWLTQDELLDFIGVAESTPGPLSINLATFIGSMQGGVQYGAFGRVLGALCATIGVVAPSFIIILVVAILVEKWIRSAGVQGFFYGVRPVVVGLVAASALTLGISVVFPWMDLRLFRSFSVEGFDWISLLLMALTFVLGYIRFGKSKKKLHPALLILLSAALGVVLFGALGL